MADVRLKRLKIENYRNVAPGTELHFGDKFNVLLGKNGTGKTTLLKLVSMIVKDTFVALAEQPFSFSYSLAFDRVDVDVVMKNEQRKVEPGLTYFVWSYDVSFRFKDHPGSYAIHASQDTGQFSYVAEGTTSKANGLPPPFASQFLRFLLARFDVDLRFQGAQHTVLRQAWTAMFHNGGGRFDEGLGGFAAITKAGSDSNDADLDSAMATLVADKGGQVRAGGLTFAPHEIWRAIGSKALAETVPLPHTDLTFLRKAVDAMGVRSAEMLMRRQSRTVDNQDGGQTLIYAGFAFTLTLRDGAIIRHEDLSYGQKRLLSFLYYAAANPDIVIADELMNGLHHDWAQLCLEEITERQSFLASQDPLLFDFLYFDSAEEVGQSFILCSIAEREGRDHFVWKNLDPESAASFYRAYEAGIQHVSEILRTKGLW